MLNAHPYPPSPLREHAESQENSGQTVPCLDKAILAQGGGGLPRKAQGRRATKSEQKALQ